ncbi:helix-turn-helix domain-containing protein [Sphingomonas sp. CFBP 13720]|uniref:helix-turn-helix domain-containing protein n=1 Tax=Sphingomonas sp. CFBP 13720 TaxID=2775302 RepID=UPI003139AF7A
MQSLADQEPELSKTTWRRKARSAPDTPQPAGTDRRTVVADRYRTILFPNRIREQRIRHAQPTLLSFAAAMPDIPYIRLSKIERGEVFARADELARIAAAIGVTPADLLIDVDAPDFDIAQWFAPFADGVMLDDDDEARMAVLLAAATRQLRATDPTLRPATIEADYGIAPVVLSRIENAQKGLLRWNAQTMEAIVRLFGVDSEAALRTKLETMAQDGTLAPFLDGIASAEDRADRTRRRIAALRIELAGDMPRRVPPGPRATPDDSPRGDAVGGRLVPLYGLPLADGLLSMVPVGGRVEAPAIAGPRAFALRVCRQAIGPGLPGQATVIVDPDRYPQAGGLALVRDGEGHRIMAVVTERDGTMKGFTLTPAREIDLGPLPPADLAAIVAALYL